MAAGSVAGSRQSRGGEVRASWNPGVRLPVLPTVTLPHSVGGLHALWKRTKFISAEMKGEADKIPAFMVFSYFKGKRLAINGRTPGQQSMQLKRRGRVEKQF